MPQYNQIDEYKLHFKNPPIIVSRRWFCQLPFEWQTRLFPFELVEILITGFTVLIDSFLRPSFRSYQSDNSGGTRYRTRYESLA